MIVNELFQVSGCCCRNISSYIVRRIDVLDVDVLVLFPCSTPKEYEAFLSLPIWHQEFDADLTSDALSLETFGIGNIV